MKEVSTTASGAKYRKDKLNNIMLKTSEDGFRSSCIYYPTTIWDDRADAICCIFVGKFFGAELNCSLVNIMISLHFEVPNLFHKICILYLTTLPRHSIQ